MGKAPAAAGVKSPESDRQGALAIRREYDYSTTTRNRPEWPPRSNCSSRPIRAPSASKWVSTGGPRSKLHEDGWLSYSPANTPRLDEAQEAELRFVGSLVIAGCDRGMLAILLDRLPKPYAYDAARLYYDWSARRWRLLPDPHAHPEAIFTDWLDNLVQQGEVSSLTGILELGQDALSRVRAGTSRAEFDRQA